MDFNALQDSLNGTRGGASSANAVEGKYVLISEIGRGSYGVVWQAHLRQSQQQMPSLGVPPPPQLYAIKQLSKHRAGAKALREVMGEVETMSLLSHPNIVRLEETFQDTHSLWIVMEYLPGGELQQLIKARDISEAAARRVVTQLLMAIEYIHDKGIVHRDLKPANALLAAGDDMTVKISDFGFAVLAGADQCLSTYCGTVAFMAPEILQQQNYGKPVDMWAIGVMTFYMMAGEYPFTGATTEAVRRAICKGRCSFSTGRLALFPLLRDFLGRLLVRNPHKRMTAREALKHPWIKVGREDNADARAQYLAPASDGRGLAADGTHLPACSDGTAGGFKGAAGGGGGGHGRLRLSASARWRVALLAIVAAHRLLYLQHCRRLTRLGFGGVRVLRDYHYCVSGRYDPPSSALDCSRAFLGSPHALLELLPMVLSCKGLTSLDLSCNGIDSLSAVQALVKALAQHRCLQSLSLAHNPIPAVAARGLLRLARNPASRITSIDITGTLIPEDVAAQLASILSEKAHTLQPSSLRSSRSFGDATASVGAVSTASTLPAASSARVLPHGMSLHLPSQRQQPPQVLFQSKQQQQQQQFTGSSRSSPVKRRSSADSARSSTASIHSHGGTRNGPLRNAAPRAAPMSPGPATVGRQLHTRVSRLPPLPPAATARRSNAELSQLGRKAGTVKSIALE